MHPYIMTLTNLESELRALYTVTSPDDATRIRRANMARAYHDRTGRYLASEHRS
jgi:hypothetical protein